MKSGGENKTLLNAGHGPSPFSNTPSAVEAGGATTAPQVANSGKRIINTAEDLVFYTDTDKKEYPIYITRDREIWLKAKPHRVEETKDKWGYTETKKIYDVPVTALFFVKEINEVQSDEDVRHSLLEKAVAVMKEVTKDNVKVQKLSIKYEVYEGDMERLLGETNAYMIKVISKNTPFSGLKCAGRKAWAVGYDWKKRIVAKAVELEKYTYIKGEEGKHGRAYVRVVVKLPVPTEEFTKLFNLALSSIVTQVSHVSELEEQIKQVEEQIKRKEAELQALKEQLSQLQLKLQLEKMKRAVVE
ncbi:MAG: hypothetical protein QW096_11950 [Thermofilaceae archaeon]